MSKQSMKLIRCIFTIVLIVQYAAAARIPRASVDEIKATFEQQIRQETMQFLNDMLNTQINYFTKVKSALPADVKRAKTIEEYIVRLQEALKEKDLEAKDKMWCDTFKEFNKTPMIANNQDETGLSDEEFEKILNDAGLTEMMKNFLADVAIYFWKMAKASGKIVANTIEEHLIELRRNNMHI